MPANGISRVLNCVPSSDTENDWLLEAAASAGIIKARKKIPATKDLRDETWWPIQNQGTTGSCVGWAVADGLFRWHFVKARRLKKRQKLSVRYVWMSAKETDDMISKPTTFIEEAGTRLKASLDVARRYGVVTDSLLQFNSGKLYPKDVASFYIEASRLKIASYFHLKGASAWRRWIAQRGPIVAALVPDQQFKSALKRTAAFYKYDHASSTGSGHAVLIVGYTPTHFIVRNSWGKGWGDRGYAYVYDAYANAAFFEAYGITIG